MKLCSWIAAAALILAAAWGAPCLAGFPAISITCSGKADVIALTANLSDLGLESDILASSFPSPVLIYDGTSGTRPKSTPGGLGQVRPAMIYSSPYGL